MNARRYSAIIFDLDDTLADTYSQLVRPALQDCFDLMIRQGLRVSSESCWKFYEETHAQGNRDNFFRSLLAHLSDTGEGVPLNAEDLAEAATQNFYKRDVPETFTPFHATLPTLSYLKTKYALFLVTAGDPETQMKKVKILGISTAFNHIFYANTLKKEKKLTSFRTILTQTGLQPNTILCVGNRLDQEIRDGKFLGMKTCYIATGEHKHMIARDELEVPDFKIHQLSELVATCQL